MVDRAGNEDERSTPFTDTPPSTDNIDKTLREDAARDTEQEWNELPPAKKRKVVKKKVTTAEKVMTGMMLTFVELQRESEERFMKYEERRANEEREHEECMLRLLLGTQYLQVVPLNIFLHLLTCITILQVTTQICKPMIISTISNYLSVYLIVFLAQSCVMKLYIHRTLESISLSCCDCCAITCYMLSRILQ